MEPLLSQPVVFRGTDFLVIILFSFLLVICLSLSSHLLLPLRHLSSPPSGSNVSGVQAGGHHILVFKHYFLCPLATFSSSSPSPHGVNTVEAAAPPPLPSPATLEDREEGGAVVAVHPAIQQRVGEGGAHGDHVEDGVKKAVVAHVQHCVVDVGGQLEGVEGQPAHGEHHHHGHQHFGGFAAPPVALGAGAAGAAALRWAYVAAQFGPDPGVGKGDDGQRKEVLQDQHRDAVDGAIRAFTGPLLCTNLEEETLILIT